ncbi:MAG: efflux RND transporter periplasmic adaptor subunit [Anaerolineae bacterium]|nr:efflux RND transporter periplasmic adaptor subunit [Anaerolineae bacterium]
MSRRSIVIIVVLVILAILAVLAYRYYYHSSSPTDEAEWEVVSVKRGDLETNVSATGSIAAKSEVSLSFKTAGRVAEVLVTEGERVTRGQVLARLDTQDLDLQVAQAQASLDSSLAQLKQVQAGPSKEDIAAAEANLASAQANLEKVQEGPSDAEIAAAEASLAAAQDAYQRLLTSPSEEDLRRAELMVEQARINLWMAQIERDSMGGIDVAEAKVGSMEVALELAKLDLQQVKDGPTAAEIKNAAAQVEQARDYLEKLRASPTARDIAAAQAQVAAAQAELARLKNSPTDEELAIAQARVNQARAALDQAQAALDGATLIAPFDGVVAVVGADADEFVMANMPMIVLADTSSYHIMASIDEADIGSVTEGQEVVLTLDAFPDAELKGVVSVIPSVSTMDGGVVSYDVRIEIQPTDLELRAGMTANATIVTARREGVLLVPNQAIAINEETGQKYVEKVTDRGIIPVEIKTGLTNELVSEVTQGLEEGDQVVVRSTSYRERFREMMRSTFSQDQQ